MSRNHEKLEGFHDAHALTLRIYQSSQHFPTDEWFGLRAQMRRAAVSIGANIVEGSAKPTTRDYVKFLHIALGSASELGYLVRVAAELSLWDVDAQRSLPEGCERVVKKLEKLTQSMAWRADAETERPLRDGSPKPRAGSRR